MLAAVGRDSLADDNAGIVDRPRDRKDTEVARGKIAKRVEIKHLAVGVKECVLGVVTRRRGPDNHSGCVGTLRGDAVGRASGSTECSQVGHAIAELRISSGEREEEEESCCQTDYVSEFHGGVGGFRG